MGKIVVANWKMNGTEALAQELITASKLQSFALDIDMVVCPPYVFLPLLAARLRHNQDIALGAQDVSAHESGAFTGEVSAAMLKEIGCRYVMIGHSERRAHHAEGTDLILAKMQTALKAGLIPIVCIGETLEERQSHRTEAVLSAQLDPILKQYTQNFIVAYEPVWAIGTGLTATENEIQATHAFLRKNLYNCSSLSLLYGGSVNAANALSILKMDEVDGVLVGGASLKAAEITRICEAAHAAGLKN